MTPKALTHWRTVRHILKKSPLEAALRRRIARSYLRNLYPGRRAARTREVAGFDVAFPSDTVYEFLYYEVFLNHCYWFDASNSVPFIVDCGSNIGMATLYFKLLYPGADILAFEPNPEIFHLLKENVTGNALEHVSLYDEALGGSDCEVEFYADGAGISPLTASTIESRGGGKRIRVRQRRLSSFIERRVDFLKIDVEGAEEAIIDDLIESSKIQLVDQMSVEYHHHIDTGTDNFSEFLCKLEKAGFGYQIAGEVPIEVRQTHGRVFQDITIYAYNKSV